MNPSIILENATDEFDTIFWDDVNKIARVTDGVVMVAERFKDELPDYGLSVNDPPDSKAAVEALRVTGEPVFAMHIDPVILNAALNAMDYSLHCMRIEIFRYEKGTGEGYVVCLSSKNTSAIIMGLDEKTTGEFKYFCPYKSE